MTDTEGAIRIGGKQAPAPQDTKAMVTKQRFKRLAALILFVAHGIVAGMPVHAGDWMPMLPSQDFYDFQLFAPPDLQDYEIYPEPSEGIFFNYDRLYWGITPPRVTGVGTTQTGNYLIPSNPISPQAIVQLNNANVTSSANQSGTGEGTGVIGGLYVFGADPLALDLNTSWMRTKMGWGNRYEGGWIYDNNGINISYFSVGQSQEFTTNSEFAAGSPTQIFTQEALGGAGGIGGIGGGGGNLGNNTPSVTTTITSESPPPDHLIAQKLTQSNTTEIQSVGVASIIRRELGKRGSGSTVRFGLGPRFMQFAERYKLGYESNQYAFDVGAPAGGTSGGGAGGGTTGGGTTGGGTTGGGTTGGGTTGGLQAGGTTGGLVGAGNAGGGNVSEQAISTGAGSILGITGVDTLTGRGLGTPLQAGAWETYTSNNMVGPEFSLLLESQQGRWLFSSELKFTAGLNWQNNLYRGANFPSAVGADVLRSTFSPSATVTQTGFGGNQPGAANTQVTLQPPPLYLQIYGVGQSNATNAAEHRFVFTPIGEWRLGTQFRVSEAIRLHAGYTGMWLGSIARASTNTGYKTVNDKPAQYAQLLDPTQQASPTNPWVVKTTSNSGPVKNPEYNRIAPVQGGQEYVLTNGVDFGIEVRY
jgi:hypothetical protein